jgi:hypothetical protein
MQRPSSQAWEGLPLPGNRGAGQSATSVPVSSLPLPRPLPLPGNDIIDDGGLPPLPDLGTSAFHVPSGAAGFPDWISPDGTDIPNPVPNVSNAYSAVHQEGSNNEEWDDAAFDRAARAEGNEDSGVDINDLMSSVDDGQTDDLRRSLEHTLQSSEDILQPDVSAPEGTDEDTPATPASSEEPELDDSGDDTTGLTAEITFITDPTKLAWREVIARAEGANGGDSSLVGVCVYRERSGLDRAAVVVVSNSGTVASWVISQSTVTGPKDPIGVARVDRTASSTLKKHLKSQWFKDAGASCRMTAYGSFRQSQDNGQDTFVINALLLAVQAHPEDEVQWVWVSGDASAAPISQTAASNTQGSQDGPDSVYIAETTQQKAACASMFVSEIGTDQAAAFLSVYTDHEGNDVYGQVAESAFRSTNGRMPLLVPDSFSGTWAVPNAFDDNETADACYRQLSTLVPPTRRVSRHGALRMSLFASKDGRHIFRDTAAISSTRHVTNTRQTQLISGVSYRIVFSQALGEGALFLVSSGEESELMVMSAETDWTLQSLNSWKDLQQEEVAWIGAFLQGNRVYLISQTQVCSVPIAAAGEELVTSLRVTVYPLEGSVATQPTDSKAKPLQLSDDKEWHRVWACQRDSVTGAKGGYDTKSFPYATLSALSIAFCTWSRNQKDSETFVATSLANSIDMARSQAVAAVQALVDGPLPSTQGVFADVLSLWKQMLPPVLSDALESSVDGNGPIGCFTGIAPDVFPSAILSATRAGPTESVLLGLYKQLAVIHQVGEVFEANLANETWRSALAVCFRIASSARSEPVSKSIVAVVHLFLTELMRSSDVRTTVALSSFATIETDWLPTSAQPLTKRTHSTATGPQTGWVISKYAVQVFLETVSTITSDPGAYSTATGEPIEVSTLSHLSLLQMVSQKSPQWDKEVNSVADGAFKVMQALQPKVPRFEVRQEFTSSVAPGNQGAFPMIWSSGEALWISGSNKKQGWFATPHSKDETRKQQTEDMPAEGTKRRAPPAPKRKPAADANSRAKKQKQTDDSMDVVEEKQAGSRAGREGTTLDSETIPVDDSDYGTSDNEYDDDYDDDPNEESGEESDEESDDPNTEEGESDDDDEDDAGDDSDNDDSDEDTSGDEPDTDTDTNDDADDSLTAVLDGHLQRSVAGLSISGMTEPVGRKTAGAKPGRVVEKESIKQWYSQVTLLTKQWALGGEKSKFMVPELYNRAVTKPASKPNTKKTNGKDPEERADIAEDVDTNASSLAETLATPSASPSYSARPRRMNGYEAIRVVLTVTLVPIGLRLYQLSTELRTKNGGKDLSLAEKVRCVERAILEQLSTCEWRGGIGRWANTVLRPWIRTDSFNTAVPFDVTDWPQYNAKPYGLIQWGKAHGPAEAADYIPFGNYFSRVALTAIRQLHWYLYYVATRSGSGQLAVTFYDSTLSGSMSYTEGSGLQKTEVQLPKARLWERLSAVPLWTTANLATISTMVSRTLFMSWYMVSTFPWAEQLIESMLVCRNTETEVLDNLTGEEKDGLYRCLDYLTRSFQFSDRIDATRLANKDDKDAKRLAAEQKASQEAGKKARSRKSSSSVPLPGLPPVQSDDDADGAVDDDADEDGESDGGSASDDDPAGNAAVSEGQGKKTRKHRTTRVDAPKDISGASLANDWDPDVRRKLVERSSPIFPRPRLANSRNEIINWDDAVDGNNYSLEAQNNWLHAPVSIRPAPVDLIIENKSDDGDEDGVQNRRTPIIWLDFLMKEWPQASRNLGVPLGKHSWPLTLLVTTVPSSGTAGGEEEAVEENKTPGKAAASKKKKRQGRHSKGDNVKEIDSVYRINQALQVSHRLSSQSDRWYKRWLQFVLFNRMMYRRENGRSASGVSLLEWTRLWDTWYDRKGHTREKRWRARVKRQLQYAVRGCQYGLYYYDSPEIPGIPHLPELVAWYEHLEARMRAAQDEEKSLFGRLQGISLRLQALTQEAFSEVADKVRTETENLMKDSHAGCDGIRPSNPENQQPAWLFQGRGSVYKDSVSGAFSEWLGSIRDWNEQRGAWPTPPVPAPSTKRRGADLVAYSTFCGYAWAALWQMYPPQGADGPIQYIDRLMEDDRPMVANRLYDTFMIVDRSEEKVADAYSPADVAQWSRGKKPPHLVGEEPSKAEASVQQLLNASIHAAVRGKDLVLAMGVAKGSRIQRWQELLTVWLGHTAPLLAFYRGVGDVIDQIENWYVTPGVGAVNVWKSLCDKVKIDWGKPPLLQAPNAPGSSTDAGRQEMFRSAGRVVMTAMTMRLYIPLDNLVGDTEDLYKRLLTNSGYQNQSDTKETVTNQLRNCYQMAAMLVRSAYYLAAQIDDVLEVFTSVPAPASGSGRPPSTFSGLQQRVLQTAESGKDGTPIISPQQMLNPQLGDSRITAAIRWRYSDFAKQPFYCFLAHITVFRKAVVTVPAKRFSKGDSLAPLPLETILYGMLLTDARSNGWKADKLSNKHGVHGDDNKSTKTIMEVFKSVLVAPDILQGIFVGSFLHGTGREVIDVWEVDPEDKIVTDLARTGGRGPVRAAVQATVQPNVSTGNTFPASLTQILNARRLPAATQSNLPAQEKQGAQPVVQRPRTEVPTHLIVNQPARGRPVSQTLTPRQPAPVHLNLIVTKPVHPALPVQLSDLRQNLIRQPASLATPIQEVSAAIQSGPAHADVPASAGSDNTTSTGQIAPEATVATAAPDNTTPTPVAQTTAPTTAAPARSALLSRLFKPINARH